MKTSRFAVEGMTCEGCASAVRRSVEQLEGVAEVVVSLPQKQVSVTFDEAKTQEAAIRERIEDAGYDVLD